MSKMSLSRVIFTFESQKGNTVYKLVTKTFDNDTSEVIENNTMITESQALVMNTELGIDIVELEYDETNNKMKKK